MKWRKVAQAATMIGERIGQLADGLQDNESYTDEEIELMDALDEVAMAIDRVRSVAQRELSVERFLDEVDAIEEIWGVS